MRASGAIPTYLGGFSKVGVPFCRFPKIRIAAYWGLSWGPSVYVSYDLSTSVLAVSCRRFFSLRSRLRMPAIMQTPDQ